MAINENSTDNNRLEELGGSDFEIADGQPNIKGWKVKDVSGNKIGEVQELIFDKVSRKVLYIVMDLDANEVNSSSKNVLLPIGLATLHESDDEVIIAELASRQVYRLPEYEKGNITPATESAIRNTFSGLAAAVAAGATSYESHPEGFYEHEHFNQKRFYGNRWNTNQ
ncbi:PRC-barrel domain containing protein [Dyadobacter flavalbus]|uniref:PRC-barrel domain containing protein n=1 Tax=Dyadobacter flavalbus TaxID=2579942 RepID=A0A5M8R022_9BACT|nr:PRC-barrel domain-containing protein [Dyadobacter flavalbus]KAA6440344.1 PRC-barrel domain containing protein [Dyadobacter flavalbus]